MIEVYFVRHGETVGNVAKRQQPDHTPLTGRGQIQAATAGSALATVRPTHLYTSPLLRAVETASLLTRSFNLIPERNELFIELRRPAQSSGHKNFGVKSLRYLICWYRLDTVSPDTTAETYSELRQRLVASKTFLTNLPDHSRVVVVSHSVFISLFVAHLKLADRLSLFKAFLTLWRIFTLKNGAVTHIVYNKVENKWSRGR